MENFDELLKKYADFIVRVGVNPQPGQTLIINCPLEGAPLARLCVRSAYEAGARDVQVNWSDDAVARARMELGSEEALTDLKPWQLRRYLDYAESEGGSEVNIAVVILKRGALQLCGGVAAPTEINAVLAVFDRAVLNDQIAAGLIIVIRPCRFARRNGSIAARAIHSGTIDAQCAAVPYLQCRGLVAKIKILVGVGISTADKVGGGARHKHIAVGSGDFGICDVQRCIIGDAQRRTIFVSRRQLQAADAEPGSGRDRLLSL